MWNEPLKTLKGADTKLAEYKGKALMLVNVASKCGLTPQYAQLEDLQDKYGPKGFTVVGFPCNQFGGQEPGSAEEIAEFCSATYGVTFPMAAKTEVVGESRHPFYAWAEQQIGESAVPQWNFHKILIGRDGRIIAAFGTRVEPTAEEIRTAITTALAVQQPAPAASSALR